MLAWNYEECDHDDHDDDDVVQDEGKGDDKDREGRIANFRLQTLSRPLWLWFINRTWADVVSWGLIYALILWIYWLSLWLHQQQQQQGQHQGQTYHHHNVSNGWLTKKPNTSITAADDNSTLSTNSLIFVYMVSGILMDGLAWLGPHLFRYHKTNNSQSIKQSINRVLIAHFYPPTHSYLPITDHFVLLSCSF